MDWIWKPGMQWWITEDRKSLVDPQKDGSFTAFVQVGKHILREEHFPTVEAAKQWCETRVGREHVRL